MKEQEKLLYAYAHKTNDQVLAELNTNITTGLTSQEVVTRLALYGPNGINGHSKRWLDIMLAQLMSPFVYILLGVAAISFFLEGMHEAVIIVAIVVANTFIGFYQEYHAERAIQMLKKYIVTKALVLRDGKEIDIPNNELVPGDIVILTPGDIIPADVRILNSNNITIDESLLTGEAVPVRKQHNPITTPVTALFEAHNVGFGGTIVLTGKATAVICATGNNSIIGAIAGLSTASIRQSKLAADVAALSRSIIYLILVSVVLVLVAHILTNGIDHINFIKMLLFVSALAVSIVPETLPLISTFALAAGSRRLAKQNAIVKRLSAVEDLGAIEILCTDKTGTLTENVLTVAQVYAADPQEAAMYAKLCGALSPNSLKNLKGFDLPLYNYLQDDARAMLATYTKLNEIPFDPMRRLTTVLVQKEHKQELVVIGAAEDVLRVCNNFDGAKKTELLGTIEQEGHKGNRVLLVAKKDVAPGSEQPLTGQEENLDFLGAIVFLDPLKKTAVGSVQRAKKIGLEVKILSGDAKEVCRSIAQQVGLIRKDDLVITGEEFAAMHLVDKQKIVHACSVFARVSPEQKQEIIILLGDGKKIAYMGDGINDVPSLRSADVGIVVDSAVDVAREEGDIILLKKDLMVVVDAIIEGRRILVNITKFLKIMLASSFGNFYTLALASLLLPFFPMLPIQILLLNFLSDFPLLALATDHVGLDELARPQKYVLRDIMFSICLFGLISSVFDFIFFALFLGMAPQALQTGWFICSTLTEIALIFSLRTRKIFFLAESPSLLLAALSAIFVAITLIIPLTLAGQYYFSFVAYKGFQLGWIVAIVIGYLLVTELVKRFYASTAPKRT